MVSILPHMAIFSLPLTSSSPPCMDMGQLTPPPSSILISHFFLPSSSPRKSSLPSFLPLPFPHTATAGTASCTNKIAFHFLSLLSLLSPIQPLHPAMAITGHRYAWYRHFPSIITHFPLSWLFPSFLLSFPAGRHGRRRKHVLPHAAMERKQLLTYIISFLPPLLWTFFLHSFHFSFHFLPPPFHVASCQPASQAAMQRRHSTEPFEFKSQEQAEGHPGSGQSSHAYDAWHFLFLPFLLPSWAAAMHAHALYFSSSFQRHQAQ